MAEGVAHDGAVWVRGAQCDACLFSPTRIVPGARAAEIVRETTSQGRHFICHKDATEGEPTAVCRSWWDRFGHLDNSLRVASRLGLIRYTDH